MDISRVTWDPKYSTHNQTNDAQHQTLFAITNHLLDIFEKQEDVFPVIAEMVNYLSIHFHTESLMMMEARYLEFIQHSKKHAEFNQTVAKFLTDYKERKEFLMEDMISFLAKWLVQHTCGIDMAYVKYLEKKD